MNLVTCSAKHSPGATTLALALTAALAGEGADGPPLLVELDTAGGDLGPRLGLPTDPGLASLAAASRHGGTAGGIWRHANSLPAGGAVVLAPTDPAQCLAATRHVAPGLRVMLAMEGVDAVVDTGRMLDGSSAPVLADGSIIVVSRPDLSGIEHTRRLVEQLTSSQVSGAVVVVTVGDRPYGPSDASAATGVPAVTVPHDPAGAASLLTGPMRRAQRSALVRSARTLLDRLTAGAVS